MVTADIFALFPILKEKYSFFWASQVVLSWNSITSTSFVVTLPKAYLTSHSRMSGCRWVITPSWLSRSLRFFLYRSVLILIPKKGNAEECSNYCAIALISHASKVMLKILQARFQQYVNQQIPDGQAGLEKAEEPQIKLPNLLDHRKSKRIPEKHLLLLYWLCQSLWLCGSQQAVENSSRDGNTRPPDLPPEKPVCRSRSSS